MIYASCKKCNERSSLDLYTSLANDPYTSLAREILFVATLVEK